MWWCCWTAAASGLSLLFGIVPSVIASDGESLPPPQHGGAETSPLPRRSIARDPNTRLVLWGTRHGNRNPAQIIKQEPRQTWGFEGAAELTKFGKRQAYGLGVEVRKFVDGLVSQNYLPSEVKYFSSSANRCQMTLQAALAAIHAPSGWADWDGRFDNWSPVPYAIDDPLLRMYNVKCPKSDIAWAPISEDTLPELRKLSEDKRQLLDYMAANTGWNASIANAADVADNYIVMDLIGAPYPDWLEKPSLDGYTKKSLRAAYMEFAENHMIACADYAPCREMMGGVWLKNIIDALRKAEQGDGPKMIGYASHTEVTLAVMKLLGYEKHELDTSAGFLIEYRSSPQPAVRLLAHDPNPIEEHVIYPGKLIDALEDVAVDGWIPLDLYVGIVGDKQISNWQTECGGGSDDKICPLSITTDQLKQVASSAPEGAAGVLALLSAVCMSQAMR